MKKLIILSLSVFFLISCEKLNIDFHKKDKPCPVVSADAVPEPILSAFQSQHPGLTVKTWFNKDKKGYAALFDNNGNETLDFFDNNGNFQKEEMDNNNNQQGDHQDNQNDDKGCDCETGD